MTEATLASRLFAELADGRIHSGQELAGALGVTRSAVWKAAEKLRALGAELDALPNRGYRLDCAGAALSMRRIRAALAASTLPRIESIDVVWSIASTNSALSAGEPPPPGKARVLLAEHQSAGRGRRGRQWIAPLGGGICLSLTWTFRQLPAEIGALGLAVGVCVRQALERLGASSVSLKWPNDLVANDAKVGGMLIEMRAEAAGPAWVVIGIGLNARLNRAAHAAISASGARAVDLATLGVREADRNRIVAALLDAMLDGLPRFEREGFKPFAAAWRDADALSGRKVQVSADQRSVRGVARGIDAGGALLVESRGSIERFFAADVSVRGDV